MAGSPGARDADRRLRRLRRLDPKKLTPSHEGRVKRFMVHAGSFMSSPEEQVSKIFEPNERKELTGIVLWSHKISKYTGTGSILGFVWHPNSRWCVAEALCL